MRDAGCGMRIKSEKIGELESEINNLRRENTELNEKLTDFERQQKEMSSRLFCVDRFTTDGDISFYTGMSSYATFMAIFEYLNQVTFRVILSLQISYVLSSHLASMQNFLKLKAIIFFNKGLRSI